MLSGHLRQSSFVNYNTRFRVKVSRTNCKTACSKGSICCFSANHLAFEYQRGARDFDPFLIPFFFGLEDWEWDTCMREPRREQLSRVNGAVVHGPVQFTLHRPAATIVTAATGAGLGHGGDISLQPETVPKPSSPRLSTYRLVSSSSGHSIRAGISHTNFPHVPSPVFVATSPPSVFEHKQRKWHLTLINTRQGRRSKLAALRAPARLSPEPLLPQSIVPSPLRVPI